MKILTLAALLVLIPLAARAATAVASIKGTADNSPISGTVTFEDTKKGLKVVAKLAGLPPGEHGFHIHEFGACSEAGKAAGGHFNPMNSPHGLVTKVGMKKAHAGDLGNITVGGDGTATLEAVLPHETVTGGKYDVAGRAVVVHEKADDFGQPVGNAGGRIACGVIGISAN